MKFETSLKSGTFVTFPGGALTGQGRIEFAAPYAEDCWFIIADQTPVHPLSSRWPDQPGDLGQITFADGALFNFTDAWTGLVDTEAGVLLIGEEVNLARKGEGDWQSVVVHIVQSAQNMHAYVGQEARFTVDPHRRKALSVAHTAAHLAALALNAASAPFWTKAFSDVDAFGRPNLDKAAIQMSSIQQDLSTDIYRLGKSLKKKGFDRDRFHEHIESLGAEINSIIRSWLKSEALISVTPPEGLLDDVRLWRSNLNGTEVTIPCGGTHVGSLSDISQIEVNLAPTEDGFVMTTRGQNRWLM